MATPGFYLYEDMLNGFRMLSLEQIGRIVLAMDDYAREGIMPDFGKDKLLQVVFEMARGSIDRNQKKSEAFAAKARENGKKGGRPKKAEEPEEKPETQPVSENLNNINQNKKEETKTEQHQENAGFADEDELIQRQQDVNEVLDAAEQAGFAHDGKTLDKLTEMTGEHGKDVMLKAIDACVENGVKKITYLRKVADGIRSGKSRDKPDDAVDIQMLW